VEGRGIALRYAGDYCVAGKSILSLSQMVCRCSFHGRKARYIADSLSMCVLQYTPIKSRVNFLAVHAV